MQDQLFPLRMLSVILSARPCYWNLDYTGVNPFSRDCNGGCLNVGDVKVVGDSWGWIGSVYDGHAGDKCDRGGMYQSDTINTWY